MCETVKNTFPQENLSSQPTKQQLIVRGLTTLSKYPGQRLIAPFLLCNYPTIITFPVDGKQISGFSFYGSTPIVFRMGETRFNFRSFPDKTSELLSEIFSYELLRAGNNTPERVTNLFKSTRPIKIDGAQVDFFALCMAEALWIRARQENPPTPLSHAFQEILSPSIITMNDKLSGLDLLLLAIEKANEYG